MFRVDWLQSAVDELTALWVHADSATRAALTAATHSIEQCLRQNGAHEGESRSANQRITFAPPLAITFQIEPDGQTVTVLQVRMFSKRKK
jgi:hypothetical protein